MITPEQEAVMARMKQAMQQKQTSMAQGSVLQPPVQAPQTDGQRLDLQRSMQTRDAQAQHMRAMEHSNLQQQKQDGQIPTPQSNQMQDMQKSIMAKLQGVQDPRSKVGMMARGKNMYPGGNAAHEGGGSQFGRPSMQSAAKRRMAKGQMSANS